MGSKMNENGKTIYRIDGASMTSPRIRRMEARKGIERNAHALVVRTTDGKGLVPVVIREHFADWWYDLRRKQNTIYGGLLRFIDVSILARVPRTMLKMIPQWIQEYIDGECDEAERVVARQAA
jgi:hypothetical protein